jgi:hypothetical protein
MHPLKQLQKLLQPKSTNNGHVIAQANGILTLATKYGTQAIPKTSGDLTVYRVGDTVKLLNGQVVGKRVNQPTVYVL